METNTNKEYKFNNTKTQDTPSKFEPDSLDQILNRQKNYEVISLKQDNNQNVSSKWNNESRSLVTLGKSTVINTVDKEKINDVEDMDLQNRNYQYSNKYELGNLKYRNQYGKKQGSDLDANFNSEYNVLKDFSTEQLTKTKEQRDKEHKSIDDIQFRKKHLFYQTNLDDVNDYEKAQKNDQKRRQQTLMEKKKESAEKNAQRDIIGLTDKNSYYWNLTKNQNVDEFSQKDKTPMMKSKSEGSLVNREINNKFEEINKELDDLYIEKQFERKQELN